MILAGFLAQARPVFQTLRLLIHTAHRAFPEWFDRRSVTISLRLRLKVMRLVLHCCSLPACRELHFLLPFGMGDRAALMRQCLSTLANQSLNLAGQGVCVP